MLVVQLLVLFAVSATVLANDACNLSFTMSLSQNFKSVNQTLGEVYPCWAFTSFPQAVEVTITSQQTAVLSLCKEVKANKITSYIDTGNFVRSIAGETVVTTIPLGQGCINTPLSFCNKGTPYVIDELDMKFYY
jgi:hypothetical protein